jgi:hypothetical protein
MWTVSDMALGYAEQSAGRYRSHIHICTIISCEKLGKFKKKIY